MVWKPLGNYFTFDFFLFFFSFFFGHWHSFTKSLLPSLKPSKTGSVNSIFGYIEIKKKLKISCKLEMNYYSINY